MASRKTFIEWFMSLYSASLHLGEVEGGRWYQKFLKGVVDIPNVMRMNAFTVLKYGYPLERTGYTCATFSLEITETQTQSSKAETYYAYAYWAPGETDRPDYVCLGPTYESRDGEYRNRFLYYHDVAKNYEDLSDILEGAEAHILTLIEGGYLGLDMSVHPNDNVDSYVESADGLRLGVQLLVASWVGRESTRREAHVSPKYEAALDILKKGAKSVVKLWQSHDHAHKLSAFVTGQQNAPLRVQCGQKLSPLTVREVTFPGDPRFAPWREVYIGKKCADLVLNFVAPGFPLHNQWAYLQGSDAAMFENSSMHEVYRRGEKAKETLQLLRSARNSVRNDNGQPDGYRFEQVDLRAYDAIEYVQSFIQTTEVVLLNTMEHVGRTIRSIPMFVRTSKVLTPDFVEILSDPDIFAALLFDYCYGAHVLHTRIGVVHTDLHLANMTVHTVDPAQFITKDGEVKNKYRNPVSAFVGTRGEADTYLLPYSGFIGMIIDFSRALLGGRARAELTAEFGPELARNFYRDQVNRVLHSLHLQAPTLVEEHQELIKGAALDDPEAVFKVLSAVDFITLGRNIAQMLEGERGYVRQAAEHREFKVNPNCIKMARHIENEARRLLITHLHDIIEAPAGRRRSKEIPFAGDVVIPAVFQQYLWRNWDRERLTDATLASVQRYDNKLRYSCASYERFPPWGRLEDITQHLAGLKLTDVLDRGDRPFLEAIKIDPEVDIIADTVRAREETDDSAAASSSWIHGA